MRGFLVMILLAGPALAQEPVFDPSVTDTCTQRVSTLPEQRACIGASATACMESTNLGYSTMGMSLCTGQEFDYWDARLNVAYRDVMAQAKRIDADKIAKGWTEPSLAEPLLAAQRAWIKWRDATCAFERAQWGSGTGGGPAALSCLLHKTAEQALYLEFSGVGE